MYKSLLKNKEKPTLLFLHGWAGSWQSWLPILGRLKDQYNLCAIDLPYPKAKTLNLDDYCQFVLDFIKKENIDQPVIVGHSLGGAIAAKIASKYPRSVSAIVLVSAAAIRHPLPTLWCFFQRFSFLLKPFKSIALRITHLDATDYVALKTATEKNTFRNLIAADLTPILHQITCPTLILWGDQDTSTPIVDGLKIHSLVSQSTFFSFPNSGHFFYLDYQPEFTQKIIDFVENET